MTTELQKNIHIYFKKQLFTLVLNTKIGVQYAVPIAVGLYL